MATLIAPAAFAQIQTRGRTYTADVQSHIAATAQTDIQDLLSAGCVYSSSITTGSGTAISPSSVTATGTDQGTAAALSASFSLVSTPSAGRGVTVASLLNELQIIYNAGPNDLNVFPLSGMAIGAASQNAGQVLGVGRAIGLVVANSSQAYLVFNSSSFG